MKYPRDNHVALHKIHSWANQTVEKITPDLVTPYEVQTEPLFLSENRRLPGWNMLTATDDGLPVGIPFERSYTPSSIGEFWQNIDDALSGTEYEIISAGTLNNRGRLFASVKISEGFEVGGRQFLDYFNIIDSFDKSASFTIRYANFCIVCENTFNLALRQGKMIGKTKHTKNFKENVVKIIEATDRFLGVSKEIQNLLGEADSIDVSEWEARQWIAGATMSHQDQIEGGSLKPRSADKLNSIVFHFHNGRGNKGRTRLDAFQGLTEYHTHASTNRKKNRQEVQFETSEFGASAKIKEHAIPALQNWEKTVERGREFAR
jgi:hypothetical protein